MRKKLFALVMSAAMVVCMVPMMSFAATTATSGDLTKAKVAAIADQTYTGQEVKPAVTVTLENGDAVPATGYTVAYKDNTNVGTATATITGAGTFSGSTTATFKIVAKTFSASSMPTITIPNQLVGTKAVTGAVVKDGTTTLQEGTDYAIAAVDNSAAGTKEATITFKGNYAGTVTAKYQVVTTELKGAIYLNDTSATYLFDGTAKEPALTVKDAAGKVLTAGTDYTVSYLNNVNAGTATIQVSGAGNYAGTLTQSFSIHAADLSKAVLTVNPTDYTYTGSAITPKFTVVLGSYTLKDADYTLAMTNNTNTGKADMTLTGKGNFTGTLKGQFNIVAADYTKFDVALEKAEFPYTGKAIEPKVTVTQGTYTLVAGTDYTVAYTNNVNAGTATVTVIGKGKFQGTKTAEFKITGTDNTITTTYTNYTKYAGSSQPFNLNAKATQGTLTYKTDNEGAATVDANGNVTVNGVGIAKITVATTGTTSANPATKVVTVTVKPTKPTFTLKSASKGKMTVTVKGFTYASKYQIKYGRLGSYKSAYLIASQMQPERTRFIKGLKSGKTYTVKVRSFTKMEDGSIIWGNWTTAKTVTIK